MKLCIVVFMVILRTMGSTSRECGVEGDPRGTPRSMNDDATATLHVFITMVFDVESHVNQIEYFAERSELTYVSIWREIGENTFQMKGKIPVTMQPGYNVYEVPSSAQVAVMPGDVVGLHHPENTTAAALSWENPRLLTSSGILSTSVFHEKLTKGRQDDGWLPGYNVTFGRQSRRAIPLTVHTAHCGVTEPPNRPRIPTIPPASSSEKSSKKSEDEKARENEAVAIGVTIPLVAVAMAVAGIIAFLVKKRYICHNTNKVQVYLPSECTSTVGPEEEVAEANDFYVLYMQYMQYGMEGENGQIQDPCYEYTHDAQVHLQMNDDAYKIDATDQDITAADGYTILPPDRSNQSKTLDDGYLTLPVIKETQEEESYDSGLDIPNTDSVCDSVSCKSTLNTDCDTARSESFECVKPKQKRPNNRSPSPKLDSPGGVKPGQKQTLQKETTAIHNDLEQQSKQEVAYVNTTQEIAGNEDDSITDKDNKRNSNNAEKEVEEDSVLIGPTIQGSMFGVSDDEDDDDESHSISQVFKLNGDTTQEFSV